MNGRPACPHDAAESERLDEQEAIAFWVVLLICAIVLYAVAAQAGLVPQVPDITWALS